MYLLTKKFCVVLAGILILSGCNFPQPKAAEGPESAYTAAAQTVAVLMVTNNAVNPTMTPQPPTSMPTLTPQPTRTQATATPLPTSTTQCDQVSFISDVTIPDGTIMAPGTSFQKTWRLRNTGSCTWTSGYRLVFDSGDALGGPATQTLPGDVSPGQNVDISIILKTPVDSRTYQGFWKLQNPSGIRFGLGDKANTSFWVKVVVGVTAQSFAVTSVFISADNTNFTGACPHTFNLTAKFITTNAGKVTYYWEFSEGFKSPVASIDFSQADTKSVSYASHDLDTTGVYWVKIYVDNPNHQYFPPVNLSLNCIP
jgi:hypothetical protein